MKRLPVHIVEGRQRMVEPVDFQDKRRPFAPHPLAPVLRVEIPSKGVSCLRNEFLGTVRLCQKVEVRGKDTIGQEPRIRLQDGCRQIIETAGQVGLASEQEFVFG